MLAGSTRPSLSQFRSLKIRRSSNFIKIKNCERVGRALIGCKYPTQLCFARSGISTIAFFLRYGIDPTDHFTVLDPDNRQPDVRVVLQPVEFKAMVCHCSICFKFEVAICLMISFRLETIVSKHNFVSLLVILAQ